jgi:hypothetical protein
MTRCRVACLRRDTLGRLRATAAPPRIERTLPSRRKRAGALAPNLSHRQLNRWTDPSVPHLAPRARAAGSAGTRMFIILEALVNCALDKFCRLGRRDGRLVRPAFWAHNFLSIGSAKTSKHRKRRNTSLGNAYAAVLNPEKPVEGASPENLKVIAAAVAILSAPSLMSHRAEAGGALAKTLSNAPRTASIVPLRKHRTAKSSTAITEYYSSSATGTTSKPNR